MAGVEVGVWVGEAVGLEVAVELGVTEAVIVGLLVGGGVGLLVGEEVAVGVAVGVKDGVELQGVPLAFKHTVGVEETVSVGVKVSLGRLPLGGAGGVGALLLVQAKGRAISPASANKARIRWFMKFLFPKNRLYLVGL
jgi:hypothetical protein